MKWRQLFIPPLLQLIVVFQLWYWLNDRSGGEVVIAAFSLIGILLISIGLLSVSIGRSYDERKYFYGGLILCLILEIGLFIALFGNFNE